MIELPLVFFLIILPSSQGLSLTSRRQTNLKEQSLSEGTTLLLIDWSLSFFSSIISFYFELFKKFTSSNLLLDLYFLNDRAYIRHKFNLFNFRFVFSWVIPILSLELIWSHFQILFSCGISNPCLRNSSLNWYSVKSLGNFIAASTNRWYSLTAFSAVP